MSKKVLILESSPRKNGNSVMLSEEFAKGAIEAGNTVETIFIKDKNIGYCESCYGCVKSGECVIKDDMAEILKKMHWADVIVMASPVYFYSLDARMKTLIDRTFCQFHNLKNKEFFYIMTAAQTYDFTMECTLQCFRNFARCLENSVERGIICANGVYKAGKVANTEFMQQAYEMGKTV